MSFVGSNVLVSLRVRNPFLGVVYPSRGELEAVLDTGYSGFLFVPEETFSRLGLTRSKRTTGMLADGRRLKVDGAFASLEFPAQGVTVDGLVQTARGATESLLGVDGIRKLFVGIDSCAKRVIIRPC